jgi:hypothetical protein
MPYEGEELDSCGVVALDLTTVAVVAVSGTGPNICGHLLLYTPANGGYYFHVSRVYAYPYYFSSNSYNRYLSENGKRELRRRHLQLPDPRAAEMYMERMLSDEWFWGVLPHNCVAFCEGVIRAGGGEWNSYSNCPVLATDVPQSAINQFLQSLEAEIYQLYGAY